MKIEKTVWLIVFVAMYIAVHNWWWPMNVHEPLIAGLPSWFWGALALFMVCWVIISVYALKFWHIPELEEGGKGG